MRIQAQPKQQQALDMMMATGEDVPTRIITGGSRGASKSKNIRIIALGMASEVAHFLPGITIYIVRAVWGDVFENHVQKLDLEYPELTKFYSNKEYNFPDAMGGPRIKFGYGDTFKDIRRVARGPEAYAMLIDQAEEFSEEELHELRQPVRWPGAPPGGPKSFYGLNPGGKGAQYFNRICFKKKFTERERPGNYAFIQSFGWENFHAWFENQGILIDGAPLTFELFYKLPGGLPPCPDGVYDDAWLRSLPDDHRFKIYVTQTNYGREQWSAPDSLRIGDLFGNFERFAGQYFTMWDPKKAVIS